MYVTYTFQDSGSIAFHVFTCAQNFYAMKHWFDRNSYLEASVHVTNIEDHQLSKDVDYLDMQQLWPAEEFRVSWFRHKAALRTSQSMRERIVFLESSITLHGSSCILESYAWSTYQQNSNM
jgi:alpha-1,4-galacturonosyltransferase